MKCRMILAASTASSLLILAGCVTVPQSDLAEAVKAAIQPAVDTFFEELDETLGEKEPNHPTGYLLRETGRYGRPEPRSDVEALDELHYSYGISWSEEKAWENCSTQNDPNGCMENSFYDYKAESAELLHRFTSVGGDRFIDWGYWSGKDDETLFEAALYGSKDPPRCPPNADCLGPGVYAFVSGTPTGTNPVSGSAIWNGFARAVFGYEVQLTGKASLRANLRSATVDVYLIELDYLHDHVWRDLDMVGGTFSREAGSWMISGAFYGAEHEGAAGRFNHGPGVVGVFGALRE